MDASEQRVTRRAARVLVLDPTDHVLLFRGRDSTMPDAGSWWFTPGGGLEPGESMTQAAIRELDEETGLKVAGLDGPVYEQEFDLTFEGKATHQFEAFFVTHVERFDITDTGWTELEQRTILGSRWWSADELDATGDPLYPECVAELVRGQCHRVESTRDRPVR